MIIKCVRCGKEILSPNKTNAYYVIAKDDIRTYGSTIVEKVGLVKLTKSRVIILMKHLGMIKEASEYDIALPAFSDLAQPFTNEHGISEEVVKEEVFIPKTAIICINCLDKKDIVIW